MIRVKIVKENKEAVNELFGLGTTGKSKRTDPWQEMKLYSRLTQIEDKMDKKKLKDLGLSLTDLMHLVEQTLGVASGKIGSLQTISMSKVQALINLLTEEYKDILEKHKTKKISAIEANNLINGVAQIANFAKAHSISRFAETQNLQEQEKIEEILGMQNKALEKFIASLKPVGSGEGPTSLSGTEDKKEVPQQKITAATPPAPPPEAKAATPPPPPNDAKEDDTSAAVQSVMTEVPPSGQQAQTQSQDRTVALVQNIFKQGLQRARFGFKTNPAPEMIVKVITYLKNNNHMNEALSIPQKGGLANRIASALGYKTTDEVKQIIEILTALDKGLKKDVKYVPASQKPSVKPADSSKPPDSSKPQVKGVTPDAKASQDIADAFSEGGVDDRKIQIYKKYFNTVLDQLSPESKKYFKNDFGPGFDGTYEGAAEALALKNFSQIASEQKELLDMLRKDKFIRIAKDDQGKILVWNNLEKFFDMIKENPINEKLNENLIQRKKQEKFSEKDAKRFKLLAGLL